MNEHNTILDLILSCADNIRIPHVRTLRKDQVSFYVTDKNEIIHVKEQTLQFNILHSMQPHENCEGIEGQLLKAMQSRLQPKAHELSLGTVPNAKTSRIPEVMAIRDPSIIHHGIHSAVSLTYSFYESDILYYELPNKERFYPKSTVTAFVAHTASCTFDQVLPRLQAGKRIYRSNWPMGQYLVLVPGIPKLTVDADRPLARAGVPVGTEFQYAEHIDVFTPNLNGLPFFGPWVPQQSDILACDWKVL